MSQDLYSREPCPLRVVEDCGGAFSVGLIGASLFHGVKGFRNAPSGLNKRFIGSLTAIKTRSPIVAGSFAMWGATFSSFDCTITRLRQKEDPWNSIISGTIAGGVIAARNGVGFMAMSAISSGVFSALIEAVAILMTRVHVEQNKPQPNDCGQQPPE